MSEGIMTVIDRHDLAIFGPRAFAYDHYCIARYVRRLAVQSRFANPLS